MEPRETFKAAMIARFIEDGITEPEEMAKQAEAYADRLEGRTKQAIPGIGGAAQGTVDALQTLSAVGLLGPPVIGGAAGIGAGHLMNRVDEPEAEDIRHKELIRALRQQKRRLEASRPDDEEGQLA